MNHFDSCIQGDKPTVVDFTAAWSEAGKIMESVLEEIKLTSGDRAFVLAMDIDKHPYARELYNIINVPTIVIFKNGHELWRKQGTASAEEILQHLQLHLS